MQVYKERVLDVAVNCGREACRTGVKRFVHMSTAQVYDCDKVREEGRGVYWLPTVIISDCESRGQQTGALDDSSTVPSEGRTGAGED